MTDKPIYVAFAKKKSRKSKRKNLREYRGFCEFDDKNKMMKDINKKRKEKRYYK